MRIAQGFAGLLVLVVVACAGGDADGDAAATDTLDTTPPPMATVPTPTGMVDPETASRDELLAIAGMTPAAADAILAARPIDTMLKVDRALEASMDTTAREAVYATLWKPLDLNSATAEEILLIPGIGERMKHEFEEYRPYTDIAQFRREMLKYVDDAEVTRLEKYVTIRR